MAFLCGLESSLECFRFDSLPAGARDGAIVSAAAGGLSTAGCDVCSYVQITQPLYELLSILLMRSGRYCSGCL